MFLLILCLYVSSDQLHLLQRYFLAVYNIDAGRQNLDIVGSGITKHEDALEIVDSKETAFGTDALDTRVSRVDLVPSLDKVRTLGIVKIEGLVRESDAVPSGLGKRIGRASCRERV